MSSLTNADEIAGTRLTATAIVTLAEILSVDHKIHLLIRIAALIDDESSLLLVVFSLPTINLQSS